MTKKLLASLVLATLAGSALAFPDKPVTIVVPLILGVKK